MQLYLQIVALFVKVLSYGSETILAKIDRIGLEKEVHHLAFRSPPCGENLPLPESERHRIFRLRIAANPTTNGGPGSFSEQPEG